MDGNGKDFYKILGVPKTATETEIKQQYRTLSKKHHPDRPGGDAEKFKEIAGSDENLRLIKLCDILDNMRAMGYISKAHINYPKISRWKNELKEYVLPIAENTNQKLYNLLSQFVD